MRYVTNPDQSSTVPLLALAMIGLGVLARVLPHPANVAPITALALFGASYLPKRLALIVPLIAMLVSDAMIGLYGPTMLAVYGSFLLVGLLGLWVRSRRSIGTVFAAAVASSLLFFVITNAAVWLDPVAGYARGIDGLLASYVAGLPFLRNTLVGDLVYTGVLFGSYELARGLAQRHLPERFTAALF